MLRLFLILAWLGAAAHASDLSAEKCDSFAFLAAEDGVPPVQLIERAYLDLHEQLGRGLDAEAYAKMAEGKDPFALPEERRAQNDTLAKRLRDLESMLEQKSWNTLEVRNALLARL